MPDDQDIHTRIGDQSLRVDKYDDAIKEYVTVLSTNPGNAKAADGLTTAYYMKANKETTGGFFGDNDYDSAISMLDKAVQMNPNDIRLRLAQAKLRMLSGEEVDLSTIGTPRNDGERISYAQALLAQNRFQESANEMNTVIGNTQNAKQMFAVADLALMIHDLDSAQQAYQKAANFPGGAERARRGLANVSKARQTAKKDLNLASDLSRKKMTTSGIDTFHDAVAADPRSADARLGLARTIEQVSKPSAVQTREAAIQYRAYVGLVPNMPEKDKTKYLKKAEKLDGKAYKKEQREKASAF
jgi:tetratricopeptide (TPR) repeat protein